MQRSKAVLFRWMRACVSLVVCLTFVFGHASHAAYFRQGWVTTPGTVGVVTPVQNGKFYVGGSFTTIGNYAGNALPINPVTAALDTSYPFFNNAVYKTLPDGSGGWYVGGQFSYVGETPRNGIAHILSDGTVDPDWNPNVTLSNFGVTEMLLSGGTLYIAGAFSAVSGVARSNVAALNADTGELLDWNPSAGSRVYALHLVDDTMYLAGDFTTIGGQSRNRLAAVDAETGVLSSWDPNVNSSVRDIDQLATSTIYITGNFTSIGGDTRNRLAEINLTTASATAWNPNLSNLANKIAIATSTLYVAGNFSAVGPDTRQRLAEVSLTTASATAWNANVVGASSINDILLTTSTVYVAGSITSIGGETVTGLGAVNRSSGLSPGWHPNIFGGGARSYLTLGFDGSKIYAGGNEWMINPTSRNRLAEIDVATGAITAWNPNPNNTVEAIVLSTSTLYVGGAFTTIGGVTRNRLAELNMSTGTATGWNPNMGNIVNSLALSTSTIFAGGAFTTVSGVTRSRLAQIGLSMASATAWNPNVNSTVNDIDLSTSTVFIGGAFATVSGDTRNRLAEISLTTASATAWNPNVGGTVNTIELSGSSLFVGGSFTTVGPDSRSRFAEISLTTASATSFDPSPNSTINAIGTSSSLRYIIGSYATIGGMSQAAISRFTTEGAYSTWNPQVVVPYYSNGTELAFADRSVLVGSFTGVAQFNTPSVEFSTSSASGTESEAPSLSLVLTEAVPDPVYVDLSISGTATNGSDYVLSTTVTIPAGQTSVSVPSSIVNDSTVESDETIILSLSVNDSSPSYVNPGLASSTYTIVNDDEESSAQVSTGGGGSGHPGTVGLPPPVTTFQSTAPLLSPSIPPAHTLLKLPDDGNPDTQSDSAVYYVGTDGKRHAFPNEKVYFSWYFNFGGIQIIGPNQLAEIPLGKNIVYRPATRMVKFMTDPKVYAVGQEGKLRWITTEAIASALYGSDWNTKIDDISDAFYGDYSFGEMVDEAGDYSVQTEISTALLPSDSF